MPSASPSSSPPAPQLRSGSVPDDPRSLLTEEMRAAVGRPFRWLRSFPISANEIRRWAMAVHYPNLPPRRFWDDEYARSTPAGGLVAPVDFNPFAWMVAEPPADAGVHTGRPWPEPELGLADPASRAYIINAMEVAHTGVAMGQGDVIESVTSLASYSEREGRLGLMLTTVTEDRWTNQRGQLVRVGRISLLRYR
jgi:hypothetical protein